MAAGMRSPTGRVVRGPELRSFEDPQGRWTRVRRVAPAEGLMRQAALAEAACLAETERRVLAWEALGCTVERHADEVTVTCGGRGSGKGGMTDAEVLEVVRAAYEDPWAGLRRAYSSEERERSRRVMLAEMYGGFLAR